MNATQRFAIRAIVLLMIVMLLWMFGVLRTGPPIVYSETRMAQQNVEIPRP